MILVATRDGLRTFDDRGVPGPVAHAGRSVDALDGDGSDLWAILDGGEIWRGPGDDRSHVADLHGHRATCIASDGAEVRPPPESDRSSHRDGPISSGGGKG